MAFRHDSVYDNVRHKTKKNKKNHWDVVELWQNFPIVVVMTGIAKLIGVKSCRQDPSGIQRVTQRLDCRVVHKTWSKTRFRTVFDCFYFLTRPLPPSVVDAMLCYAHNILLRRKNACGSPGDKGRREGVDFSRFFRLFSFSLSTRISDLTAAGRGRNHNWTGARGFSQ